MRRTRSIAYPVLALTLALTAGAAGAQTTPARIATVHIDIKPQSLGSALTQFGAQTGIRVFVYSDIAAGLNTGGVSGQLSADDALSQLLANTGLTYSYINPKAVEIHRMTESIRGTSRDTQMAASPATAAAPSDARAPTDEADLQASHDDRIQTVSEVIVTAQKRKKTFWTSRSASPPSTRRISSGANWSARTTTCAAYRESTRPMKRKARPSPSADWKPHRPRKTSAPETRWRLISGKLQRPTPQGSRAIPMST